MFSWLSRFDSYRNHLLRKYKTGGLTMNDIERHAKNKVIFESMIFIFMILFTVVSSMERYTPFIQAYFN